MSSSNPTCKECVVEVQAIPVKTTATVEVDPTASRTKDSLDVSTFTPPTDLPARSITIEFCDRELFLTFPPPALKGVYLVPRNAEETAGRFRVWLSTENGPVLVWDRKVEGGFPELKILKQRIRDQIDPGKSLGHSDKHS